MRAILVSGLLVILPLLAPACSSDPPKEPNVEVSSPKKCKGDACESDNAETAAPEQVAAPPGAGAPPPAAQPVGRQFDLCELIRLRKSGQRSTDGAVNEALDVLNTAKNGISVVNGLPFVNLDMASAYVSMGTEDVEICGEVLKVFKVFLGPGRIKEQKVEIQDFLTAFLTTMGKVLTLPLRDGHALQFKSEGVERELNNRPEIAALKPTFLPNAEAITTSLVGFDPGTDGVAERFVNQFLANAAINGWSVEMTNALYKSLVDMSSVVGAGANTTCPRYISIPLPSQADGGA